MAHPHKIYDGDPYFVIDPVTRAITNRTNKKITLMQFDHNSERFTFEIPRMVEGHDMSLCDRIDVHYLNIEAATKSTNTGVYEVADAKVSGEDSETVVFSWLISQNATKLVGGLSFIIRFACTAADGTLEYVWSTAIYSGITVSNGIYNSENIVEQYADVLEQWKTELEQLAKTPGASQEELDALKREFNSYTQDADYTMTQLGKRVTSLEKNGVPSGGEVDTRDVILAVGDSICCGSRNANKGYVGDLGLPYENRGVDMATLGKNNYNGSPLSGKWIIRNQIEQAHADGVDPYIIIAEGGVNDYIKNNELGNMPTAMATSEEYFTDAMLETALGGLEKLLYDMWQHYPTAQKYFLLPHKMDNVFYNDAYVDWTTQKNEAGYSLDELYAEIAAVCEIYKVSIIDVRDSEIDLKNPKYISKYGVMDMLKNDNFAFDTATDWIDKDCVHPFAYGYVNGYIPVIHRALFGDCVGNGMPVEASEDIFYVPIKHDNGAYSLNGVTTADILAAHNEGKYLIAKVYDVVGGVNQTYFASCVSWNTYSTVTTFNFANGSDTANPNGAKGMYTVMCIGANAMINFLPVAETEVDKPNNGDVEVLTGEKEWQKVANVKTTEDATYISITEDMEGNPLSFDEAFVIVVSAREASATTTSYFSIAALPEWRTSFNSASGIFNLTMFADAYASFIHISKTVGNFIKYTASTQLRMANSLEQYVGYENGITKVSFNNGKDVSCYQYPVEAFNFFNEEGKLQGITVGVDLATSTKMGAGTVVEVWTR